MSNFYNLAYCPKCNQMTNHIFHDSRSVDRETGPKGESYKMICQKCQFSRWETEDTERPEGGSK